MTDTSEAHQHRIFLWDLLDDIDTLDDACKDNDAEFRNRVRQVQRRRFEISSSNGYSVTFTRPANTDPMTIADDDLRKAAGVWRKTLEFYANEENWRMNGPLDVNSPRFDGETRVKLALETTRDPTDQPEPAPFVDNLQPQICVANCGLPAEQCACYRTMMERYPYTHHGPAVHGDKLTDFYVSEANMKEDGLIPDDQPAPQQADPVRDAALRLKTLNSDQLSIFVTGAYKLLSQTYPITRPEVSKALGEAVRALAGEG
ncbi:hypothetical protein [uncultured Ruegeria sp.]|uniref:hypothetical protein n=1 Tax=uncultured Ruegeria sp. TaxID=259304 RepID=UPI00263526F9|nr:hypothetical protein [uncultured Ruegeria sp.]